MNKRIESQINKIYKSVFDKVFKTAKSKNNLTNEKEIKKIILNLKGSKQFDKFCRKFSVELAKVGLSTQRGIWKKYFQAAKSKGIIAINKTYKDFEINQLRKAIKHNFKMIKSIPNEVLEVYRFKYTLTLINQVARGKVGRKTFENELKKSGATRARLIARTETAKLQTAIDEGRAKDLGSIAYIWLSSNDKRTRSSHRQMNNVVVFWRKDSEKPLLDKMRGNAGEFPNCRCSPLPIFDESDLKENYLKLYDYRYDKIVLIDKSTLIQYLKIGEII